jgi:signal transduction histidine kinase
MVASLLPILLLSFLPQLLTSSPLVSYSWTIPAIILLPASYAYASLGTLRKRLTEVEQVRDELAETRHRLVEQREAERTRLSRELHDGPVQELLWLQTQLRRLERKLTEPPTSPQLEELRAQLQETISELRAIGLDLRPPILSEHGLRAAIQWHASMIERKYPGLTVLPELADDGQKLAETQRVALFRIYQEAVQNVAKHAQATCVRVRFALDDETVALAIADEGRGFQVPERLGELVWGGHLGMVGMAERVEALAGQLEITSTPGGGTTITITAPLFPNIEGQTGGGMTHGPGN